MSQTSRFSGGFPVNLVTVFTALPTLGISLAILHSEGWDQSGPAFMMGLGGFISGWILAELVYQYGDGRGGLFKGKGYGTHGVFAAWFALVLAKAVISLALGIFVHYEYLHLLLHLDVFPLLTFVVALLRQRVAARTLEKAQWPINLALVLLVSYVAVGAVIGFSPLPPSGYLSRQYAYQILDLLNCIPLLLLLWRLRLDAQKLVVVSGGRVHFRGADISGRFHPVQIAILSLLGNANQHGINCRRISLESLPGISVEKGCTENQYCKPSICNRYMKIYREVNDLRKRLEQLGIGTIRGPENKRDIGDQGWSLQCYPGVKLLNRSRKGSSHPAFNHPGQNAAEVLTAENGGTEPADVLPRIHSGAAFALVVSAATSFDIQHLAGIGSTAAIMVFLMSALLWLLPFTTTSPKGLVRTITACGLLIQAGTIAFTTLSYRNAAFFLLIRGFSLLLLVFMYNMRPFDNRKEIRIIRTASYGAIFWILWFYVTGLQVLRGNPPAISGLSALVDLPWVGILFFDRLLLILVFAYSVGFIMSNPRLVSATASGLCINGRTIAVAVGASNATLLARFIAAPQKTLICRDIVAADYPDETQLCMAPCKSASCPAYQRIYK
ncbi:MAG: hypothetical protein ABIJ86_06030, partial [Spirochaetota bacterium]